MRDQIRKTVQKEFSLARTGIEFVGWHPCDEHTAYDLQIAVFSGPTGWKNVGGAASVGIDVDPATFESVGRRKGWFWPKSPFVLIEGHEDPEADEQEKRKFQNRLNYVVIHEFGHAAGLLHEEGPDAVAFASGTSARVSVRDTHSIMDAANGEIARARSPVTTLCRGDQHALRCLYRYRSTERLQKCRPNSRF